MHRNSGRSRHLIKYSQSAPLHVGFPIKCRSTPYAICLNRFGKRSINKLSHFHFSSSTTTLKDFFFFSTIYAKFSDMLLGYNIQRFSYLTE